MGSSVQIHFVMTEKKGCFQPVVGVRERMLSLCSIHELLFWIVGEWKIAHVPKKKHNAPHLVNTNRPNIPQAAINNLIHSMEVDLLQIVVTSATEWLIKKNATLQSVFLLGPAKGTPVGWDGLSLQWRSVYWDKNCSFGHMDNVFNFS